MRVMPVIDLQLKALILTKLSDTLSSGNLAPSHLVLSGSIWNETGRRIIIISRVSMEPESFDFEKVSVSVS